jgi:Tol biopolymer transport system component
VDEEPAWLIRLDLETLEKNALIQPPAGTGVIGDLHPSLSQDGSRIAFGRSPSGFANLDIWIQDVREGSPQQVTSDSWAFCHSLVWTPGGEELLFTAGSWMNQRVYRVHLDEGTPRQVQGPWGK